MGRGRMPTYEPQNFETRYGECTIEQGTIHFHEGATQTARRTISGVREMDFDALKKPTAVLVTLYGALWTFQDLVVDLFDGRVWAIAFGLLIVSVFVWQCYLWLRRWLIDPSEIRCSDIESVTSVTDDTLRIEYKNGPKRVHHDVKLPRKKTNDTRQRATHAFEEKGGSKSNTKNSESGIESSSDGYPVSQL